ncbi:hypothetical protein V5O48_002823 [Marasmius crinis-equi]|uniref:Ubiquitin-like protease family profile domain-containing protein n=1 Tax=Marasmius crinis-equi TaxID=585013 RepID=A0ABR3FVQ0_9AGAR
MGSEGIGMNPPSNTNRPTSNERPVFTRGRNAPNRFTWEDEVPKAQIPVKEWLMGLIHVPERCVVSFMSEGLVMEIGGGSCMAVSYAEIAAATINGLDQNSSDAQACIQIITKPMFRDDDGWGGFSVYFDSGDRRKGRITFKSNPGDKLWKAESWEVAERALDIALGERCSLTYGREAELILWKLAKELTLATLVNGMVRRDSQSDPHPLTQSVSLGIRASPPSSPSQDVAGRSAKRPKLQERGLDVTAPGEIVLKYTPLPGQSINITVEDVGRLQPFEYINDVIMEFGLKLWLQQLDKDNSVLADQIYVFSTFFYQKLDKEEGIDAGYRAVARWTNKVDLFQKKYVFVPINKDMHWFLAVLYQPRFVLDPVAERELGEQIPYIFIMDSLGQKHNKVIEKLSRYLELEAAAKHRKDGVDLMKPIGRHAQVPTQPNFCDCGLYVLHFARTFVERADRLLQTLVEESKHRAQVDRVDDWNARSVGNYRQVLLTHIQVLSKEWKERQVDQPTEEKPEEGD